MLLVPTPQQPHRATPGELVALLLVYVDLLVARISALEQNASARAQALPLSHFLAKGVPEQILLWMLYQHHIEHFQKIGPRTSARSEPQPVLSLRLQPTSSFALTDVGWAFADRFLSDILVPAEEGAFAEAWDQLLLGLLVPRYDTDHRLFTWGAYVLKQFRQPSPNQELILCAAEELGWPAWFDDPLPRRAGLRPKTRLHDTIKDLNRWQRPCLVHFKGNGDGSRLGWELR
jgi:hypothetical protein